MSKSFMPYDPKRWGPPAWEFLYCVAFSYPHKPNKIDKKNMIGFIRNFSNILPCQQCKANFKIQLKGSGLQSAILSKVNLVKWIMKIKNDISRSNGVPNSKLDNYNNLCKTYLMNKL